MNPTPAEVHVNVVLGNVSVAYAQQNAYIADRVFPQVPVRNMSNYFRRWNRGGWFRAEAKERAPATPSVGSGQRFTLDTYLARVYAFHQDVDGQTIANADSEFDLDRTATEFVTAQLLLTREAIFQSAYFKQGVWTNDYAGIAAGPPGANQFVRWSTAGSTPIEDIRSLVLLMARRTGYRPNKLIMAPDVANVLELHAEIIDRIKYVQRGIVGTDLLAALFGVPEVMVPDVIINSAPETNTDADDVDANFDFVYSGALLLVYAPDRAGLMQQSAGYIFVWTAYSNYGARMKKIPMPIVDSNRVEGDMAFDVKLVSPNLGAFVRTAI